MASKKGEQLGVKMSEETLNALKRIAAAKETEAQELLRRAAYAVIEYATANGDKAVPLDMEIMPANSASETQVKLAEELYSIIVEKERKKKKP